MRQDAFKTIKFVLFGLLLILWSCEGPQGPQGNPEPTTIYASGIVHYILYNSEVDADIDVANSPSIPGVQVNGLSSSSVYKIEDDEFSFEFDDLPISLGDSVHVSITYTRPDGSPGLAESSFILPGSYEITSYPDTLAYPLLVGDSLTVEWSQSYGADCYWIWGYINYDYIDTSGINQSFHFYVDTLIADMSITLTSDLLFPDPAAIDSILYESSHFHVKPKSGPWGEGAPGNVTGDGTGFFNGWGLTRNLSIDVIIPD
jgi:hypothetical protein